MHRKRHWDLCFTKKYVLNEEFAFRADLVAYTQRLKPCQWFFFASCFHKDKSTAQEQRKSGSNSFRTVYCRFVCRRCSAKCHLSVRSTLFILHLICAFSTKFTWFLVGFEKVLKTRLVLRKTGEYDGIADCFKKVSQREGLTAFYKGFIPNILGIIPYAGVDLATYEVLWPILCTIRFDCVFYLMLFVLVSCRLSNICTWNRKWQIAHRCQFFLSVKHFLFLLSKSNQPFVTFQLVFIYTCVGGATSTICGQLISYPLALVRTRLQAQEIPMNAANRDTMTKIFSTIWKNEGLRGLYRGLLPNIIKVVPAVSLSYIVYEHMKRLLVRTKNEWNLLQ